MIAPNEQMLRALGLDDASFDAAWDDALRILAAEGYNVPDVLARVAAAVDHWHAQPHTHTFIADGAS